MKWCSIFKRKNSLFISCKRFSELASESVDCELSSKEKVAFKMHWVLCMVCRRYYRQIKVIDAFLRGALEDDMDEKVHTHSIKMNEAAKSHIHQQVCQCSQEHRPK